MPYVPVRVEVAGETQLQQRLRGAGQAARDLSPALEMVADHFEQHMASVFETGGAATASGFPRLSEAYDRWKQRHYPGRPVLTLSGELGRSFSDASHPDHVRAITGTELVIGSRRRTQNGRWVLGDLHQRGTDTSPRRRIINLPEWVRQHWLSIFRDHLRKGVEGKA